MLPGNHGDLLHRLYRSRVELDDLERRMAKTAAIAKAAAIASAGYDIKAFGTNEKEQQRQLELVVIGDGSYQELASELLEKRRSIATLEAEIDTYKETKQAAQWAIRARMTRVLEGNADMLRPEDRFFEEALAALIDSHTFPREEVTPALELK